MHVRKSGIDDDPQERQKENDRLLIEMHVGDVAEDLPSCEHDQGWDSQKECDFAVAQPDAREVDWEEGESEPDNGEQPDERLTEEKRVIFDFLRLVCRWHDGRG